MLSMYPVPQLPNQLPFHVHGMPKFHVQMNEVEGRQPRMSTVLNILKKRRGRMQNPVVRVLLGRGMWAWMGDRKSSQVHRKHGVSFWLLLQHQAGHITPSLKKGGRMKNGRLKVFARGFARTIRMALSMAPLI